MRLFNYLFYFLLFVGFFLPTNSTFHPFGLPVATREIAFVFLPLINMCCWSTRAVKLEDKDTQYLILTFIMMVIFNEFILKVLVFGTSLLSPFKVMYVSLPLFSCYFILLSGIRADIEIVWKTILLAVIASVIISFVALIYFIPIYTENEDVDILVATMGRLSNANAPFGFVGLYFLFKGGDKWYNKGVLPKLASILSIIALLLTFNRTYLVLLILSIIVLSASSLKTLKYIFIVPVFIFLTTYIAYNRSESMREQIDRRIIGFFENRSSVMQSAMKGNRDVIYRGIEKQIKDGYWVIGMPFEVPIFVWEDKGSAMKITDTTAVNILLRFGLIPLFIFSLIYYRLYIKSNSSLVRYLFIIFFFASLNMDALFRHNSVLFLILCIFIIKYTSTLETLRVKNSQTLINLKK